MNSSDKFMALPPTRLSRCRRPGARRKPDRPARSPLSRRPLRQDAGFAAHL